MYLFQVDRIGSSFGQPQLFSNAEFANDQSGKKNTMKMTSRKGLILE
jgi:hypothetical protein